MRLARTLRHHRPDQLIHYLLYRARQRLPAREPPPAPEGLFAGLSTRMDFLGHAPWHDGNEIRQGRFQFLNREVALGFPPDWNSAPDDLLWRFHLHGFAYLSVLDRAETTEICRSWSKRFQKPDKEAWHPYPLSQRIAHWCGADVDDRELLASLYRQAAHLSKRPEYHLRGNHLLENARALALAGQMFSGQGDADRWYELGMEILLDQLEEQVLTDGGHFERSPMYHALMLELVLDVLNVIPAETRWRPKLERKAAAMLDFLASMSHPDGSLARFSDTTQDVPPPSRLLLSYGRALTGHDPESRDRFPETGYYRFAGGDWFLVVDGGPIGAEYLPGHGHADLFSFEMDWRGEPWIVDTGVYEYVEGSMREYVRSTAAHNTVCIDGTDQAECWASFRVGRRYPARDVTFESCASGCRFTGRFEGYAHLIGDNIVHTRKLALDAKSGELRVRDRVAGRNRHRAVSRLHLHPSVVIRDTDNGLVIERSGHRAEVTCAGGNLGIEDVWFCPEFGRRTRNRVIRLEAEGQLPHELSYVVRFGSNP